MSFFAAKRGPRGARLHTAALYNPSGVSTGPFRRSSARCLALFTPSVFAAEAPRRRLQGPSAFFHTRKAAE